MRWLISLLLVVCTSFCMAFPFTPHTTFTDDATPAIDAAFLNDMQGGTNAAAIPAYDRVSFYALSDDPAIVQIRRIGPLMIKDAVTSQYVGLAASGSVTMVTTGFGTSKWQYIYVRSISGVPGYLVSDTAPEATLRYMTGDETNRYICAIYCDGSSHVRPFHANGGPSGTQYTFHADVALVSYTSIGSTAWQTVTLAGATSIPPFATIPIIRATLFNSQPSAVLFYIRGQSATGTRYMYGGYAATTASRVATSGVFEVFGAPTFDWSQSDASLNVLVDLVLDGFRE